ncbi:alpha/beta fold hydrolase [Devosia submarina]|uniref:alpha/beta fold hydrolase n=1 Tax=Devosia submarina TaxID=1173082 RepID=UPI000D39C3DA|nr:alpha/beta hydrolase [Devosia submarina]
MPLLSLIRFLTTLLSLIILGFVAYLLWSWNQGDLVQEADGDLVRVREDWRLWTALALGAFSFLGKFLVLPLLAKPDRGEPSRQDRGAGRIIPGAQGAQLYVEELGTENQNTIILTHGWAMDNTIWHYAKRDLSKHFRVIVWDLPGLGQSKGEISLESFAGNLAAIVEHTGAERVGLVGHSIGGMTIQTLARDNPAFFNTRIAGAVLVNTTYTNPLKTMILARFMQAIRFPLLEPVMRLTILLQPLAWLSMWQSYLSGTAHIANRLGFGKYVTRSQLDHVTLLSTKNPPGNIQKGNLAMFRWDATGALASASVPVLLLAGELDIVTKPFASVDISGQARTSSLETIEGVNHMGLMERSDVYNAAMIRFFQSVF